MNHHRTGAQSPWRSQNGVVYGAWRRDWTRLAISPAPPAATRTARAHRGRAAASGSTTGCPTRPGPRDRRPSPSRLARRRGAATCVGVVRARVGRAAVARAVADPPLDPPLCGGDGCVASDRLVLGLLLGDRRLQRAQDVVVRARVGLHVRRQMLERLAVAMHRIGLVDPAVVPVVQQELPARRRRLRGRRANGRADECRGDKRGHD